MSIFPPIPYGRKFRHYRHYPSRFDVYQPSGWNSPITKKIINIYWRIMVAVIKMLIIGYLAILAFAGSWLFFTVITL